MPVDQPPPRPWTPPVSPAVVERLFHPVAPYAPGGHRGIDLRARAGDPVRAPCAGEVTFRGSVAGGPPTVTLRCGDLRATVQRVAGTVGRGERTGRGDVIGIATSAAVDLSARTADGRYRDPLALLAGAPAGRPAPPPLTRSSRPTRPGHPSRRSPSTAPQRLAALDPAAGRPADLPAHALVADAGSRSAARTGARPGRRTSAGPVAEPHDRPGAAVGGAADRPLALAALGVAGTALAGAAGGAFLRLRRRPRSGATGRGAYAVAPRR